MLDRRMLLLSSAGALALPRETIASVAIDEQGDVPVGGIPQWIAIQGHDRSNPAILYLHGGPGEADSEQFLAAMRKYVLPLTRVEP